MKRSGLGHSANNLNQYAAINVLTPTYDNDGNMLTLTSNNNTWNLNWNIENRLQSMVSNDGTVKLEFIYDYMGRRGEKKVYSGNSGNWTLSKTERFVYDEFKQIEKLDGGNNNAIVQKFTWQPEKVGLDVPLAVYDVAATANYYYLTDANKNIGQLADASGATVAQYEYSPFGEQTLKSGDYADANPFRFSSEYYDTETSLVYYNYRYYSPLLGKWLSRDPIEEKEEYNLYIFVRNNANTYIDGLGLDAITIGPITIPHSRRDMTPGEIEAEDAHEKQHRDDFWAWKNIPGWKAEQRGFLKEAKILQQHIAALKRKQCLSQAEKADLEACEKRLSDVAKFLDNDNAKEYWNSNRKFYQNPYPLRDKKKK